MKIRTVGELFYLTVFIIRNVFSLEPKEYSPVFSGLFQSDMSRDKYQQRHLIMDILSTRFKENTIGLKLHYTHELILNRS